MITSLLDTDMYKLSQQQIALNRFSDAHVKWQFKCRNADVDLRPYADEIYSELAKWANNSFKQSELDYIGTLSWVKPSYLAFLKTYRPDLSCLKIWADDTKLNITVEGSWTQTILWEVPLLAIVNEVYFSNQDHELDPEKFGIMVNTWKQGRINLESKCDYLQLKLAGNPEVSNAYRFSDFGTRRRYSGGWQREVVSTLQKRFPKHLIGTSNVLLAKELGLKAIGTQAHEFWQVCQAYAPLDQFLDFALSEWLAEFNGDLGIALSDIVGMRAFLKAFNLEYSNAYAGARHDSGDPADWCYKLIDHYNCMGIDSTTKTAVFSDGLTFPKSFELTSKFHNEINVSHGIGTYLTNDMGVEALQVVMKIVECNGQPVAKLSDSSGKAMCNDDSYVAKLKAIYNIE